MGWKITLGCAIFALGFDLFLEPNSLNVGGMSGLAMILRELLGFGSIGVLTMLLNVPLFVLGARKLGKQFLFGSLAGMLLSSAFIDLFAVIPAPKTEILLDSLYGGLLVGLGLGLVFLSGATTGGSDIAAKLLRRRGPAGPAPDGRDGSASDHRPGTPRGRGAGRRGEKAGHLPRRHHPRRHTRPALRCRPLEGVRLALIRCLYLADMDHLRLAVADLQRHIVRELSRQLLRQTIILVDMLDIRLRHTHRVDRRLRQTPKILGCCPVHRRPLL